jgi:hypothetical protein
MTSSVKSLELPTMFTSNHGQKASKLVAIAVPLSNRTELTPDEEISFKHLVTFLGKYDKYLVIPRNLKVHYDGFGIKRFSDKFFGSGKANGELMLSPSYYKTFSEYKYVLIYQLDALVFSDQLTEWCEKDLDYIGAPWLPCQDTPYVKVPKVGNGGFSLRKVESFLKVLESPRYTVDPNEYWNAFCLKNPKYVQFVNLPRKYLKRLHLFNSAKREAMQWQQIKSRIRNEDHFWSDKAAKYYPDFKIASVEEGLRFSFEVAPRKCFELTNHTLPFGCHAWPRYDRDFWKPYLLQ